VAHVRLIPKKVHFTKKKIHNWRAILRLGSVSTVVQADYSYIPEVRHFFNDTDFHQDDQGE